VATLTYSQLEGLWIKNGGQKSLAPLMAAIALAESGGRTDARNDKDNGGTQSSFGLWQISTGTHNPPASNWADPNTNAKLAMGKLKSQGLKAWGTYNSGAYKKFLANGVPATDPGSGGALGNTPVASPAANVDDTCAWKLNLPMAPDVCIATHTALRQMASVLITGAGVFIGLVGLVLLVGYGLTKSDTVKDVAMVASKVPL
jgi:hypothetical protein